MRGQRVAPSRWPRPRPRPTRAALRIVAFSRSSRPTEPISWLSETWHLAKLALDDLRGEQLVPGRDRREHAGDRDLHRRRPGATSRPRNRATASVSERREVAAVELDAAADDRRAHARRRRPGPPASRTCGRTAWVAGLADPDHRDPAQLAPLQHGVGRVRGAQHHVRDPAGVHSRRAQHGVEAAAMPPVTSGVHAHLGLGQHLVGAGPGSPRRCWCRRRRYPRRQSSAGTGQLLHRDVVEVVAERARPGRLQPARRCARPGRTRIAITVTRWPYRTRSVAIASAVSLSSTVIRSGTEAITRPCSRATRFSFCISRRISRPRPRPGPRPRTDPRTNPLVVRRSTSTPCRVISWNAADLLDQLGHRVARRAARPPRRS